MIELKKEKEKSIDDAGGGQNQVAQVQKNFSSVHSRFGKVEHIISIKTS